MKDISASTLVALLGCTFVTGLIDAVSVLGLGHVFVANMTGNVVFLGFNPFSPTKIVLGAVLLALLGFLAGAIGGGRAGRSGPAGRRTAFAFEVALMLSAGTLEAWRPGENVYWLVLLLAAAMGIRTAIVRALAVPDLTTTVLTLTLAGIAADSTLAGGSNPRLWRRLLSVVQMLAGASSGALLFSKCPAYEILVAGVLEAAAVTLLQRSLDAQALAVLKARPAGS
jgi:uncharacterized membrane protein YoaK (UPF0700 family)